MPMISADVIFLLCFSSHSTEKKAFLYIALLVTILLVSVSVEESRKKTVFSSCA